MYNEKRKPHYGLRAFQTAFTRAGGVRMTRTATCEAERLGFTSEGVAEVVRSMDPGQFYKSMTANCDHRLWQDVYHVPFVDIVLYVKFSGDRICEFCLLSFKEK